MGKFSELDPKAIELFLDHLEENLKLPLGEDYDEIEIDGQGTQIFYRGHTWNRKNGPAFIAKDGTKIWVQNGLRHRLDGPAYEGSDGTKWYYIQGLKYTKKEYLKKIKEIKNNPSATNLNPAKENYDEVKTYKKGEDEYGTKKYFLRGEFHRLDGPAFECPDGEKRWYQYGKAHRLDGPAFEWADGTKWWFIEGIEYTKKEFLIEIKKRKFKR